MTSLLKGKLESLPDEKIQEIFSNALSEFFKTNNGQKLFYTQDYYNSTPKPTPLLVHMVENSVSKELLRPCVDELIATLKDNYVDLLKTAMVETFSNMFFSEMHQSTLQNTLATMAALIDRKMDAV